MKRLITTLLLLLFALYTSTAQELESGELFVQVMSEGYVSYGQNVTTSDGVTLPLQAILKANFAQTTLKAPYAHSEIWLGGKKIGTGSWSGRLNAGTYSVEVRTEGYETAVQNIEVEAETPKSHTLVGGIAIDIHIEHADYWRWSKSGQYRNRIPEELVRIFEQNGFIWGGRWSHFDTMHFEYRPELLP